MLRARLVVSVAAALLAPLAFAQDGSFVVRVRVLGDVDPGRAARLEERAPTLVQRVSDRLHLVPPPRIEVVLVTGWPHAPPDEALGEVVEAPPWAAGVAEVRRSRITLYVDRIGRYPFEALDGVFAHEVAHLIVGANMPAGRRMPRWYDEGIAMLAAGEPTLMDRWELLRMAARGGPPSLSSITRRWPSDQPSARSAYAVSSSVVRFAHEYAVPGAVRRLVAGLHEGWSFDVAFARSYGRPVHELESAWRDEIRRLYLVLPFLVGGAVLNGAMGVLAVLAFVKVRARRRRRLREMEMQDRFENPRGEWYE